jgi:error-prone DNA polymerase
MFITIEDETGIANLILWPSQFAKQRRLVLSASMVACRGQVQQAEGVTHMVVEALEDLSGLLRSVGLRDAPPAAERTGVVSKRGSADFPTERGSADFPIERGSADFPIERGRGDEATRGGGPDAREVPRWKTRDIYVPDGIKVPTRDFR